MTEVFVCDAVRTPFGRYGGALSSVRPDDLGAIPIRALIERHPAVNWAAVDDVVLGCANQAGEDNRNVARMSSLLAGLPVEVPGTTINRLCGSGLDAIAFAGRTIRCGEGSLIIAGGVESMSRAPLVISKAETAFSRSHELVDSTLGWRFVNPRMNELYGIDSMAQTAENVAAEHKISRRDQDAFALCSQQRAAAALAAGRLAHEIVPVTTPRPKGESVVVTRDEQPRSETTLERLAGLRGLVKADGTVTAGNASGLNDGACAVLLASADAVGHHGLVPKARVVAAAVAGVAPRVMGLGPIPAIRKVLTLAGLTLDRIDVMEINEAFAAQVLAILRGLGIADDDSRANPNGGAIALGHPLGASGARLLTTAMYELGRSGRRYALCAMCIGVGQGIALVIERV